jgi:hypothetical protein
VTVRFDPPALGSPEYYEVEILELLPASWVGSSLTRILTRERPFQFPPASFGYLAG